MRRLFGAPRKRILDLENLGHLEAVVSNRQQPTHSLRAGLSGAFYSPTGPALPPLVTAERRHLLSFGRSRHRPQGKNEGSSVGSQSWPACLCSAAPSSPGNNRTRQGSPVSFACAPSRNTAGPSLAGEPLGSWGSTVQPPGTFRDSGYSVTGTPRGLSSVGLRGRSREHRLHPAEAFASESYSLLTLSAFSCRSHSKDPFFLLTPPLQEPPLTHFWPLQRNSLSFLVCTLLY